LIYAWAAVTLVALPASRQSLGTRFATTLLFAVALLDASLAAFYALQRMSPDVTANPWLVRFARYGFYSDLVLQLGLAWAMVRLLIEDSRRESDDTRAHLRLVQDRDKLGDLYDQQARLLGRRAFDALVGLDFARASFGSVAHVRITNFDRIGNDHSPSVAHALVAHVAGVLDSAVRAHDRVYRWAPDELLVVMPRAIPAVARSRVEFLAGRAAPLAVSGLREPVRAELAVSVHFFAGGEDLASAAKAVVPA
jgi:GGDEF domain-containing protein